MTKLELMKLQNGSDIRGVALEGVEVSVVGSIQAVTVVDPVLQSGNPGNADDAVEGRTDLMFFLHVV